MSTSLSLLIGGSPHRSSTFVERIGPLSRDVATRAVAATVSEANAAAAAAQLAFATWSVRGPNDRRAVLYRAASALEARVADFVDSMMSETGSTEAWARFNVMLAAGMIREAASLTTQISGEVIPSDKPGCLAFTVREPAGVVLGIAPWNAPVILGVRAIAVPLACGNTVVLKASEICPRTHSIIIECFIEAGMTGGIVNLITNAPQDAATIVGALIDHPAVRRINFTGSTAVGRIIAIRAAQNLKPALLELGGKAPLLVLDDADLEEAVKACAFGAFMNQGQICMSTELIIVDDSVADTFAERFSAKVSTLRASDPRVVQAQLGAVVDCRTVSHVEALIEDAIRNGASRLIGGVTAGPVMPPTVLDNITPSMKLFRDESFGPIVGIVRASGEQHAIALANQTEYGLSASVFTKDAARGLRVAKQIKSGICHINGPTVHDEPQMPFGGVKNSGYGRFGGKAGIDAFTELRWITVETQPGHYPI